MLLLCRFFLGVLVPCQTYRCPSGSRVAESRPSRIALKGKGELVRMADEKEVSKQCRVGAEAVSLALRAHLWNEVYVKSVPDNPGPVAHTRKPRVPCSTHMTVHPSGTCHLSRQVIAGEGRREAALLPWPILIRSWEQEAQGRPLSSRRPSFSCYPLGGHLHRPWTPSCTVKRKDIPWGPAVLNPLEVRRLQGLPEIPESKRGIRASLVT